MDMNPVDRESKLNPRPGVPIRTDVDALASKIKGDISAHNDELEYRNADPSPAKIIKDVNYYPADRAGHPVKKFDLSQNINADASDPHTPKTKE
jgi:hypothetical protein